jgi:hypothetical protein
LRTGFLNPEQLEDELMPTAVAAFEHVTDAQAAIRDLRQAGFTEDEIGVVAHDRDRAATTVEPGATSRGSKAGEGAAAGAAVGGGGAALWSLGVAAGMLPAIGPVIAGGVFAAALASAAGGAAVGGVAGALIGAGIPEEEARRYDEEFSRGRTIISVTSATRSDDAQRILDAHKGYRARVV